MLEFYHYAKCDSCRRAKKFLDGLGVSYKAVDITVTPPPLAALRLAAQAKGIKKLFNTSGIEYKEKKLKDRLPEMSGEDALRLLSASGRLVKRPFAVSGRKVTVGFDPEEYRAVWGGRG